MAEEALQSAATDVETTSHLLATQPTRGIACKSRWWLVFGAAALCTLLLLVAGRVGPAPGLQWHRAPPEKLYATVNKNVYDYYMASGYNIFKAGLLPAIEEPTLTLFAVPGFTGFPVFAQPLGQQDELPTSVSFAGCETSSSHDSLHSKPSGSYSDLFGRANAGYQRLLAELGGKKICTAQSSVLSVTRYTYATSGTVISPLLTAAIAELLGGSYVADKGKFFRFFDTVGTHAVQKASFGGLYVRLQGDGAGDLHDGFGSFQSSDVICSPGPSAANKSHSEWFKNVDHNPVLIAVNEVEWIGRLLLRRSVITELQKADLEKALPEYCTGYLGLSAELCKSRWF